jgi:glycosyltransferase involved in cell wall biosynthesis
MIAIALPPPLAPTCPDSGIPAGASIRGAPAPDHVLPGLSVVLPCFDDARVVADAIVDAANAAARMSEAYEILVVDDGSTDGTTAAASRFADGTGRVRVLVHPEHHGAGAAIRTGIAAGSLPWVLLADPGLRLDVRALEDFVLLSRTADLVLGRWVLRAGPLPRRLYATAWNQVMRRLFDLSVCDVDCTFKLVRRELLADLELTSDGAMLHAELLVRCRAAGARIVEHDVHHRPRGAREERATAPYQLTGMLRELASERRTLRRLSHSGPRLIRGGRA